MSKFIRPFNRFEILTSDLRFMQNPQAEEDSLLPDEIRDRLKDSIARAGIIPAAGTTAVELQAGVTASFTITDATAGNIDVGSGIAFDENGDRIEIPVSGDSVSYDSNAPNFTTDNITGSPTTPFSTGRLSIPPGGADPNDGLERFVFIAHLPVVRTEALPPDHEGLDGNITTGTTKRKPITGLDQKQGIAYAHHFINGYEITVAETADVILVASTPPQLVANTKAIYIGKFTAGVGSVTPIVMNEDVTPRQIIRLRAQETGLIDGGNKPPVYADQQNTTLQEHVSATGSGVVTPQNPHGTELIDLLTTTLEPTLAAFQDEAIGDGLTDKAIEALPRPLNVPIDPLERTAFVDISDTTSINLIGNFGFAPPTGTTTTLLTGPFNKKVVIEEMTTGQALYVAGDRNIKLGPTINEVLSNGDNNAFVPFDSANTTGTYIIFAAPGLDAADIDKALVGKAIVGTTLDPDRFVLGRVFWDSTNLILGKSEFNDDIASGIDDRRVFGVITESQISTSAISDPKTGLLANQVFTNNVANSDFRLASTASSDGAGSTDLLGWSKVESVGTVAFTRILDPTQSIDTLGPKTDSGAQLVFTKAGEDLDVSIRGEVFRTKPIEIYTISAWMLVASGNTVNISVRLTDSGFASISNVKDLFPVRDGTWQRVAIPVTTTGAEIDPGSPNLIEFKFSKENANLTTLNAGNVSITNVTLMEGEWVLNHAGPRAYSGEIFMWDKTTSCPPGSVLIPGLTGRMPVGSNAGLNAIGVATAAQQSSHVLTGTVDSGTVSGTVQGDITATIDAGVGTGPMTQNASHGHNITKTAPGTSRFENGAGSNRYIQFTNTDHNHSIAGAGISGVNALSNTSISASLDSGNLSANLSQYVVLFCRRL